MEESKQVSWQEVKNQMQGAVDAAKKLATDVVGLSRAAAEAALAAAGVVCAVPDEEISTSDVRDDRVKLRFKDDVVTEAWVG